MSIVWKVKQSQHHQKDDTQATPVLPAHEAPADISASNCNNPEASPAGKAQLDTSLPLTDFFPLAVEQNRVYYASRQDKSLYASPMFRLARCLKAHPQLEGCTGEEAFERLNAEVKPDWGTLLPEVSLPSLEFVTAWEQVNIPAGQSPWEAIEDRVINEPLTLLRTPTCEGYEHYLGIAFHLQRLTPRRDILLPVGPLSGLLTTIMGKPVSPQSVSQYCRRATQDGYIKLIANAHHPSGTAARYRFDLKRFTEVGVELDPNDEKCQLADTTLSHGTHGIEGIHGIEGNHGTQGSCGTDGSHEVDGLNGFEVHSSVLTHAYKEDNSSDKSIEGKNKEEDVQHIDGQKVLEEESADTTKPFVKMGTRSKIQPFLVPPASMNAATPMPKPDRPTPTSNRKSTHNATGYRLAMLWQKLLNALEPDKYHKPLTQKEWGMLAYVGDCVGERAEAVVEFVVGRWREFVEAATRDRGLFGSLPAKPDLAFFVKNHASAVNLMTELVRRERLRAEQQAQAAKSQAEEEQRRVEMAIQRAEEAKRREDMLDCISERYSLPRDRAVLELEDILELCGHPSTREELAKALDEWESANNERALPNWEEERKKWLARAAGGEG